MHVNLHSLHEPLGSQQGAQHADQFRTFFIDGCCVEVIDRLVFRWLHRVGRRASILTELGVAQHRHILNALHRLRMQICGEALITEHRQAFFERQLEPIPAGDSISAPVVKVFMGNHTFDAFKFCIGGRFRISQNKL